MGGTMVIVAANEVNDVARANPESELRLRRDFS